MSKLIESLRGDLTALHAAGAVSKVTMREFEAICPPSVRSLDAVEIKRLREGLKFSQPVFALHLNTSASTQGRPRRCAAFVPARNLSDSSWQW